jgi:hypothetical protein
VTLPEILPPHLVGTVRLGVYDYLTACKLNVFSSFQKYYIHDFQLTDGVSFYNVLQREAMDRRALHLMTYVGEFCICNNIRYSVLILERLHETHVRRPFENDDLASLMNGVVRKKLKIIPDSVTWSGK